MDSHPPLVVDRGACRDYARSSRLEWIEANGTGAFAMGTVSGANTRRYHALLVSSLRPPLERYVLLSKVAEEAILGDDVFALDTNQFPETVSPSGYRLLNEFRLDPFPVWTWQLGPSLFTKQVFLARGKQTVMVRYSSTAPCRLRIRPFLAFRQYHFLTRENPAFNRGIEQSERSVRIRPYASLPALSFQHSGGEFHPAEDWYRNFEYLVEYERGLDFREDLYTPGFFEVELNGENSVWLAATTESDQYTTQIVDAEAKRHREQMAEPAKTLFEARLVAAADKFLARRADGRPTVIAGFPWFTDWGRDTMISIPGLLIARGRLDEAREIIEGFLGHLKDGLIPNRFPDKGCTPEFNTADATLWMFQAVWSYLHHGGSSSFLKDVFYPAAKSILEWHLHGTPLGVRVDPNDQLLIAGASGSQLTWMDVKIGDWVATPRQGKPVEVNALWYNAIRMMERWAMDLENLSYARWLSELAAKVEQNFRNRFWNSGRNCLFDVVDGPGTVEKLRPNQIFAVALPFPLLEGERARAVVDIVERELLTRCGLRTLERGDPDYRGRYEGNGNARDRAYHQGTVWPWLLGPFLTAYLKAYGPGEDSLKRCRAWVAGMEAELTRNGLGAVCEIYDGDPPHQPRGCPAQAWSVAELIRVLRIDLAALAT